MNHVDYNSSSLLVWGPAKWRELHARPMYARLDNLGSESEWIDQWVESIPCGKCKAHFEELRRQSPEVLDSKFSYWSWGVKIHNDVNEKLGKPKYEKISYLGDHTPWIGDAKI